MKLSRFVFFPALVVVSLLLLSIAPRIAIAGDDWRPIDPSDLKSTTPVVDKDADAEAIFWEVRVDDSDAGGLTFNHYVRVKVFTERGKESQSKIDIPYYGNHKIKDIAARTIKADGTIVDLKKEDVFERTIVKISGLKVKTKSFAMPSVEPGAIIEYRWREVRSETSADYVDLQFQREIPVRSVTYMVKPYSGPYASGMRYKSFHIPNTVRFEKAKNGFFQITMTNVPAFNEEPRMPPEDQVRQWILLYHTDQTGSVESYWQNLGKRLYDASKDDFKVNDDVRRATTEAIGNATDDMEKLRKIYDYCQNSIKNVNYVSSGLTKEEREKYKRGKSPADTLKRGMGTGSEIDHLFGAMAAAAGFESHLAMTGNREYIFFPTDFPDPYFLINRGAAFVAVKVGNDWRFFSPAEKYTPFGMLGWREEGENALIASKDPAWVATPISHPEATVEK